MAQVQPHFSYAEKVQSEAGRGGKDQSRKGPVKESLNLSRILNAMANEGRGEPGGATQ